MVGIRFALENLRSTKTATELKVGGDRLPAAEALGQR